MNSGLKIRNSSLAISAIISALIQNLVSIVVKDQIKALPIDSTWFGPVSSLVIYIITFLLSVFILQKLAKVKWIRVHIFKEKIVEGKWVEIIYEDAEKIKPYCYGIADTYFDSSGEFIYEGIDYDLENFQQTGKFESTCSSLKYYSNSSMALLDYAYKFENGSTIQNGYGNVNFVVGKNTSNKHSGIFFNNDGKNYYFDAKLITDKKDIAYLSESGLNFDLTFKKLIKNFVPADNGQGDVIKDMYWNNPEQFKKFADAEDTKRNLKKFINENFDCTDKTVLDVGTGTGRIANYVSEKAEKIICTDSAPKMIEFSKINNLLYAQKTSYCVCEHTALPAFVKEKVDYIFAGYSFGTYFNNNDQSDEQIRSLVSYLIDICRSLLKSDGTLVIIELFSLNEDLMSYDLGLRKFYALLEQFGFEQNKVDTSFYFNDKEQAVSVIKGFWGEECVKNIAEEDGKWYLKEITGVWTKKFI